MYQAVAYIVAQFYGNTGIQVDIYSSVVGCNLQ
jgi:hypothetical protein